MVCLGIEPGAAGWKARTNPLSYGGTPIFVNNFYPSSPYFLGRTSVVRIIADNFIKGLESQFNIKYKCNLDNTRSEGLMCIQICSTEW